MAHRLIHRANALTYCLDYGYISFIDLCIKEKVIIIEDEKPKLTLDFTDSQPLIIKRYGKIIYED